MVGFEPGDGAVETSAIGTGEARLREKVQTAAAARSERCCRNAGANSAFNMLERRGTWQPCGNGALPGGTHSSAFSELKITPDENSSK
jgi:hypothetical protein